MESFIIETISIQLLQQQERCLLQTKESLPQPSEDIEFIPQPSEDIEFIPQPNEDIESLLQRKIYHGQKLCAKILDLSNKYVIVY